MAKVPTKTGIPILTDFGDGYTTPAPTTATDNEGSSSTTDAAPWGIHALPLDYVPFKDYVAKAREVFSFEREGNCVVCKQHMPPGEGVYAICSNDGCEGVGHITCWSQHLLPSQEHDSILPVEGTCPKCRGSVKWGDMMTELTLRLRGAKKVDKLLKKKGKAKS
jgi:structure-specific endonuclease subunit SLX1